MMHADAPVRIVICEDSRTYSAALTRFLEHDPEFKVVAIYPSCEELMRGLPTARADLVTMDIDLPGLDGLDGTKWIMGHRPLPIVILSAHAGPGSAPVAAALAAGALDAIDKSSIRIHDSSAPSAVALRRRIKHLARTRATTLAASSPARPRTPHQAGARLHQRGVPATGADRPTYLHGVRRGAERVDGQRDRAARPPGRPRAAHGSRRVGGPRRGASTSARGWGAFA